MITIKLLTWFVVIIAFIIIDRKITKGGGKPNYIQYFIGRGFAAILHGAWILPTGPIPAWEMTAWELLISWLPYLLFQVCSFWIVYEIGRNIWTKKPLLYYDQKENDSGIIDRFFAWTGPVFHAIVKVAALVIMILSIITIYTNG